MKKDKKWLKEQFTYYREAVGQTFNDVSRGMNNAYDNVEKLIDQLDEPEVLSKELPVIPKFVADWIEEAKDRKLTLYGAIHECPREVDYWLVDGDSSNQETFARAWLDGYEVEKEKKYYVDLDTAAYVAKWNGDNQVGIYTDGISGSDEFEFHLTEKEIKDYDKRYWAFAEEVKPCN